MRILIAGSSGLIGTALTHKLVGQGHEMARLVRRKADRARGEVYWDPERGSLDKGPLEDFSPEAVVNLSGDDITKGRWTRTKKAHIKASRVNGTRVLAESLASLQTPPKVFINASAIGYYGSRGDDLLIETSPPGEGFLPEVAREWEAATQKASEKGIRVVLLRIGMVLSPEGGALKKMLPPFKLGLGGVIGNGRQFVSWIDLTDLVEVLEFCLEQESLSGPVNAVSPNPVSNRDFTKTLGRVLFRPTLFPLPASTARLFFGEMAEDILLASDRVKPMKLEKAGFHFKYPELKASLKHQLEK